MTYSQKVGKAKKIHALFPSKNDYIHMANDSEIRIGTKIDESGIDKGTKSIGEKLKKLGSSSVVKGVASVGQAISGIGLAAQAAISAVSGAVSTVLELTAAYNTQSDAETRLEIAAKNNPYLDDYAVQKLKSYAGELQSIGEIGDESLLPMMANLAASGRTQSEIQGIMSAALEASATGFIDMQSAVQALNGSYEGSVGSLGKLLPSLKNLTEEELKSGKAIEAVKNAYGGMSQATANVDVQLSNSWGDLKEKLGGLFAKIVVPLQKGLLVAADAANALWDRLSNIVSGTGVPEATTLESRLEQANVELTVLKDKLNEIETAAREAARAMETGTADAATRATATVNHYAQALEEAKAELEEMLELKRKFEAGEEGGRNYQDTTIAMKRNQIANLQMQVNSDRSEPVRQAVQNTVDEANAVKEDIQKHEELIETLKAEIRERDENARRQGAMDARDKLRAEYDETIKAKKKEIALRRSAGENITKEAEAQELYNTAMSAYVKMMGSKEFEGNNGNYIHEVRARNDIASWAKTAGLAETKKLVEDFEKSMKEASDEISGFEKNKFDELLDSLDAEFNAVISNKYLEEEKKLEIEEEYAEMRKKIAEARNDEEARILQDKLDGLMGKNETFWDMYLSKKEQIEQTETAVKQRAEAERIKLEEKYGDDKEGLSAALVELEERTARQMEQIDEAYAQNRAEMVSNLTAEIAGYTSQLTSTISNACNLMLETSQNEAEAEQKTLEAKYKKGEISEEEYNEAITESKRKAAKEQYKIQMIQWSASILEATANIAQGITKAIATGGTLGLITGSLVGAAGAVQIASIIASKPVPPSFSTGGIVAGSSMHGDNIAANLNSREMIMNMSQQKALWDFINGGSSKAGGGTSISINNSASNMVSAKPTVSKDRIEIAIDARVTDSLRKGRYDTALATAQSGMDGEYYGI